MENLPVKRKLKKADILFVSVLLLMAAFCFLWFLFQYREQGKQVQITVDGELYGNYPLTKDREISIEIQGEAANTLNIQNKRADMSFADCPDQLCVHQQSIDSVGETIVCLPNRVVVTVTGAQESELDTTAR